MAATLIKSDKLTGYSEHYQTETLQIRTYDNGPSTPADEWRYVTMVLDADRDEIDSEGADGPGCALDNHASYVSEYRKAQTENAVARRDSLAEELEGISEGYEASAETRALDTLAALIRSGKADAALAALKAAGLA